LRVLIIGSGGREHAIAWRLAQSPTVSAIFATPGNPGIAKVAQCLKASAATPKAWLEVANAVDADLTVVGPEAPLAAGIVDAFRAAGRTILGPAANEARLESSKTFSKEVMRAAGAPTARYVAAESHEAARAALERFRYPLVIKADGLAAGKGVSIVGTKEEAESVLASTFSTYGSRLLVEEFLTGEEVSFIVLTDGRTAVPLAATQDHKAAYDGDEGPNTGGMGAYCDDRILTAAERDKIMAGIIHPVLEEMRRRGAPFTGFLYAGLMMTASGPQVLEFNVRLSDPEAQALLHRLDVDLGELLWSAARGTLADRPLAWLPEPSVCVVMASRGYPATSSSGDPITGIEAAEAAGATVFHAGTRMNGRTLETAGGRILGVTARGDTLPRAIDNAYRGVSAIDFPGKQYRTDIGRKGLRRW